MSVYLIAPPIVFLLFVVVFAAGSKAVSRYSKQDTSGNRNLGSYASGQRDVQHYVNPDYTEFFPYAFFFTIMHVLVLVIATAPYEALLLPIVYVAFGILSLIIIFKR